MDNTKDIFLKLFGKQIKQLRVEKKLSLRELSIRCNIDYSDISKIEKGKRNIQLSTLLELAKGLEVHPKELLNIKYK
ncbi:helix-turn-helix transcriptional regulator [Cellulophaga lytica]|uniref:helix-turn-helix domain-containing protein n=1 Tax=Cellulophaga omnivescoria TaxID=1888890 RepID=UPI000984AED7|nr:helix-turn-helix transcriptional regulator [Cellulophaga omnivescoria]WKB81807.1 helix-turn-helix transcriptional regulator [Cellulophaga lytica]